MARALLDMGNEVYVLTPKRTLSIETDEIDPRVQHIYTAYWSWMPTNDIGLHWFFPLLFACVTRIPALKFDRIYVSMPPFFSGLAVWLASILCRFPFSLIYRDLWAGDPYRPTTKFAKAHRVVGKVLEPYLARTATSTFLISPTMLIDQRMIVGKFPELLLSSTGYSNHDVGVLTEETPIRPSPTIIVSYVGSIDENMGADNVGNFLNALSKELDCHITLRHTGRPTDKFQLPYDSKNVSYIPVGEVPHSSAIDEMRTADILLCLATSAPQRLNRKIFEYLAVGKKIILIGSGSSETERIASLIGKTVFISLESASNADKLSSAIKRAASELSSLSRFNKETLEKFEYRNICRVMILQEDLS